MVKKSWAWCWFFESLTPWAYLWCDIRSMVIKLHNLSFAVLWWFIHFQWCTSLQTVIAPSPTCNPIQQCCGSTILGVGWWTRIMVLNMCVHLRIRQKSLRAVFELPPLRFTNIRVLWFIIIYRKIIVVKYCNIKTGIGTLDLTYFDGSADDSVTLAGGGGDGVLLPGGGGVTARKKRSTSSQPQAALSNHYKRIILYVIHHFIGDGVSIKEITGDFQKLLQYMQHLHCDQYWNYLDYVIGSAQSYAFSSKKNWIAMEIFPQYGHKYK